MKIHTYHAQLSCHQVIAYKGNSCTYVVLIQGSVSHVVKLSLYVTGNQFPLARSFKYH